MVGLNSSGIVGIHAKEMLNLRCKLGVVPIHEGIPNINDFMVYKLTHNSLSLRVEST